MARRDAEGNLIRPPRRTPPEYDGQTLEGLLENARFWLDRAAELSGYCMSDNLDNRGVVRDCHDIIGALSAVQSAMNLIELRAKTRPALDGDEARCPRCQRWFPHDGEVIASHFAPWSNPQRDPECSGSWTKIPT